jgi:drug/metabolite transporter (DMT)-like permease
MTNASIAVAPARGHAAAGWINGLVGMLIFSGSLPATRVGVQSFDPLFLTFARAALAGLAALAILVVLRPAMPERRELPALAITAFGVVLGFPLLTALALRHVTSAHAIVFIGLLPMATAIFGALRAGERPRPAFWFFAALGAAIVSGYALAQGAEASLAGDALMLAAVIVCGLGYAEGAILSRRLGGWQVICWALLISLPFAVPLALWYLPASWSGVTWPGYAALAYVSLFSMLVGFFFWYRGLAQGGIAAVGQLQLLQPFCGLALAGLLLGERIAPSMGLAALAVMVCVFGAKRYGR